MVCLPTLLSFVMDFTNVFTFVSIPVRISVLILFVALSLASRFLQLAFRAFSLHELS